MSVPEPKAAFGRVPCQVAKVPNADIRHASQSVESTVIWRGNDERLWAGASYT
jgi:hypothetical protein